MRRRRGVALGAGLVLAAALGWGGPLFAGPPAAPTPPVAGEAGEAPPSADEVRRAMQDLMLARMKRALRLTPDQERRVVPRMRALFAARREFAARRRAALARLRTLALDESADDAEVVKALAGVREIEARFREREAGMRDAVDAELSPRQRVRLLFFEERFRRAMQRRLQPGGPGGAGRRGGGRPEAGPTLSDPLGEDDGGPP